MVQAPEVTICSVGAEHEIGWRALWAAYCGDAVTAEITEATWQRMLDAESRVGGVVATIGTEVVGFITFVEHDCTWEIHPVCYVEDLYVAPLRRGRTLGVGAKMGAHLLERLNMGEWARLYGITKSDNLPAQHLYRAFAQGEPYLRYVVQAPAATCRLVQRGPRFNLWVEQGLTGFVESSMDERKAGRFTEAGARDILTRLGGKSSFEIVHAP